MNATLSHLPEYKQAQLREIKGIIVKAVDPEKVILFGSHATGWWVEHRYTEGAAGEVHVFQLPIQQVGNQSIWRLYEFPGLKANPKVTNIVFHIK